MKKLPACMIALLLGFTLFVPTLAHARKSSPPKTRPKSEAQILADHQKAERHHQKQQAKVRKKQLKQMQKANQKLRKQWGQ